MNYNDVFKTMQEQYTRMDKFLQKMDVCIGVLRENNSVQTINNKKILKRIARIETQLNIIDKEGSD